MTEQQPSNGGKLDAVNPYFLHHSDHPGMVLVSKPLNGDNYSTWCRAMTISLNASPNHKRRRLMQFLMRLNESYNAIRGQILLMNPLPDVAKAYSSIVQEEKQRSLGATRETTENSAMVVQRAELMALAVRHGQGSSSRSNPSNRKPLHCSYCDRDHHVRETCWKLNGYPPEHPKHASNRSNHESTHFKRNNSHQSSANNVKERPVMQEVPSMTNGLSDLQIQQILSIMQGKGQHNLPILKLMLLPQDLTTRTTIGLGEQRDELYYLVALASEKPKTQTPSAAATSCRSPQFSGHLLHRFMASSFGAFVFL
ncbi:hypothetical protein CK203_088200 [Vitis vinifera]|uniref:Retrotransposon Copia-like N-terminal domain-containing protein n=1 Tax=Vitis vinifera TaxID=29760 RepID=A0A438DPC6_VITVI|nr:hypothetical protein CK203_088200 [Vitis vinifera]